MYTVFLSGSRKLSRLNDEIRDRLQTVIDKDFKIIVGDANGADKAFQSHLAKVGYTHVIVFCSGSTCRNNVGAWEQKNVHVDNKLSGREFYTQKDKAMAAEADYGFVIWDGKSAGSISNVLELLKNQKPSVVYFSPDKTFHAVKSPTDAKQLMQLADAGDYRIVNEKISFDRRVRELGNGTQASLSL